MLKQIENEAGLSQENFTMGPLTAKVRVNFPMNGVFKIFCAFGVSSINKPISRENAFTQEHSVRTQVRPQGGGNWGAITSTGEKSLENLKND